MRNHGAAPTPYDFSFPPPGGLLAGKKFLEARHGRRAPRIRWIRGWGCEGWPFQQALADALVSLAHLEQDVVEQEHAGAFIGREHRQNVGLRVGPKINKI